MYEGSVKLLMFVKLCVLVKWSLGGFAIAPGRRIMPVASKPTILWVDNAYSIQALCFLSLLEKSWGATLVVVESEPDSRGQLPRVLLLIAKS